MPPLFEAFRALGHITEATPFATQRRGKESFVTVSVGSAWQVWIVLVVAVFELNTRSRLKSETDTSDEQKAPAIPSTLYCIQNAVFADIFLLQVEAVPCWTRGKSQAPASNASDEVTMYSRLP